MQILELSILVLVLGGYLSTLYSIMGIYQAEVRHLIQQIHLQIMMELDMLMTNPLLVAGANENLR